MFERALALDPANVMGLVGIASVDLRVATVFLPDDQAARIAAAEESLTKALSLAPENATAHLLLGWSKCIPIASFKASDRASERCTSIETWLPRTRSLATASLSSVSPRRQKLTSRRRCASVPATVMSAAGACTPDWLKFSSAGKRRRSFGCAGRSKPTGIVRTHISFWGPLWDISAGSLKRGPKFRRDWQSTPRSQLPEFALPFRVITPPGSQHCSASLTACARPGPPRNDRAASRRKRIADSQIARTEVTSALGFVRGQSSPRP